MPYTIETKDGIKVHNVPDNWAPDDPRLKPHVEYARRTGKKAHTLRSVEFGQIGKGIVQGLENVGQQLLNIAGIQADIPQRPEQTPEQKVGSFIGELGSTALMGGPVGSLLAKGARAVPFLRGPVAQGTVRGMGEGATEGAILAGPENRLEGAGTGAAWGGPVGGVLAGARHGVREPTPEASRLMQMGVDLTPGQMKPAGTMNMLEQVAESVPIAGTFTSAARRSSQEDFAQAMVNSALPPGADPVPKGNIDEMSKKAYQSFAPAYAVAKGHEIPFQALGDIDSSFRKVLDDPGFLASSDDIKAAEKFLNNEMSRFRDVGQLTSDNLLSVRSNIRNKVRSLRGRQTQREELADMLDAADDELSAVIFSNLPDELQQHMKAVDRQYAKYKVIERAAAKTKAGTVPTPNQWAIAAQQGATPAQRAHSTFPYAQETSDAMQVFETTAPRTGARAATLGAMGVGGAGAYYDPVLAGALFTPVALASGTRRGRLFSIGQTPLQRMARQTPAPIAAPLGVLGRGALPVYSQQD